MDFYTSLLRKSRGYWVALCLENGIVGQGVTKEEAIEKLKEAIESFEDVYKTENNIYMEPLFIRELHEFLTMDTDDVPEERVESQRKGTFAARLF